VEKAAIGCAQAYRQQAFILSYTLKDQIDPRAGGIDRQIHNRILYGIEDQLGAHLHVGAKPLLQQLMEEWRGTPGDANQDQQQGDQEPQC